MNSEAPRISKKIDTYLKEKLKLPGKIFLYTFFVIASVTGVRSILNLWVGKILILYGSHSLEYVSLFLSAHC